MKKTTRVVIETKGGFRFGYERIVEKPDPKKIEKPKPIPQPKRIAFYA